MWYCSAFEGTYNVQADDLSVRLLDLAELHQEVPETRLCNHGVGCKNSHAVQLWCRVCLRGQMAANDLVFRKTTCGGMLARCSNSVPIQFPWLYRGVCVQIRCSWYVDSSIIERRGPQVGFQTDTTGNRCSSNDSSSCPFLKQKCAPLDLIIPNPQSRPSRTSRPSLTLLCGPSFRSLMP